MSLIDLCLYSVCLGLLLKCELIISSGGKHLTRARVSDQHIHSFYFFSVEAVLQKINEID